MKKTLKRILVVVIGTIMIMGGVFVYEHERTKDGIPIIGYHEIVEDAEKETKYADNRYCLSKTQFSRHMQYLYEQGYQTLSLEQVYDYYQGKIEVGEKVVALTFDDGYKSFNTIVKPILEKYQFQGTAFVLGKHVNDSSQKYLKTEDIVNTDLIHYYSHSYDLHREVEGYNKKIMDVLSLEEIDLDFQHDEIDHTFFAFPYGKTVDGLDNILKKNNVKMAFGYNEIKHLTRDDDIYNVPRYMFVDIMPDFYFHWIVE